MFVLALCCLAFLYVSATATSAINPTASSPTPQATMSRTTGSSGVRLAQGGFVALVLLPIALHL